MLDTADDFEVPTEPNTSSQPAESGTPSPTLPPPNRQTLRGRTVRTPTRYQEFVKLLSSQHCIVIILGLGKVCCILARF